MTVVVVPVESPSSDPVAQRSSIGRALSQLGSKAGSASLGAGSAAERTSQSSQQLPSIAWEVDSDGIATWDRQPTELIGTRNTDTPDLVCVVNGRSVRMEDFGDALLSPMVVAWHSGVILDSIELIANVVDPAGRRHEIRLLARSGTIPMVGEPARYSLAGVASNLASSSIANSNSNFVPSTSSSSSSSIGPSTSGSDQQHAPPADGSSERLELLVEHSPDGIVVHQDGIMVYANPAAAHLVGVEVPNQIVGRPMGDFIHPDRIHETFARMAKLQEPGVSIVKGDETLLLRADKSTVAVEVASVRTTWKGRTAYQAILHDLTARIAAESSARARRTLERRYAAAVAVIEEGVVVIDHRGVVEAANQAAHRILGARLAAGRGDTIFTHGGSARRSTGDLYRLEELPIAKTLLTGRSGSIFILGVAGNGGSDQWLSVTCQIVTDDEQDVPNGVHTPNALVCAVADISEHKHLLDRISWEAHQDASTDLANRSGLLNTLQQAGGFSADGGLTMYLASVSGLDGVSELHGSRTLEEVLRELARRCRTALPNVLVAARVGDNRFALVESGELDPDAGLRRGRRLLHALGRPIDLENGRLVQLDGSVVVLRHGSLPTGRHRIFDSYEFLLDAEAILDTAGPGAIGQVIGIDGRLKAEMSIEGEISDHLKAALEFNLEALNLHVVPLTNVDDGQVAGWRAQIRWDDPRYLDLASGRIAQIARKSGHLDALCRWTVERSCRYLAELPDSPPEIGRFLAVDIDMTAILDAGFQRFVAETLSLFKVDPARLVMEVSASALSAKPELAAAGAITALAGCRYSIAGFDEAIIPTQIYQRMDVALVTLSAPAAAEAAASNHQLRVLQTLVDMAQLGGAMVAVPGNSYDPAESLALALRCGADLVEETPFFSAADPFFGRDP